MIDNGGLTDSRHHGDARWEKTGGDSLMAATARAVVSDSSGAD